MLCFAELGSARKSSEEPEAVLHRFEFPCHNSPLWPGASPRHRAWIVQPLAQRQSVATSWKHHHLMVAACISSVK